MSDLNLPAASDIVKTNEELLSIHVDITRANRVESCFSSYLSYAYIEIVIY